MTLVSNPERQAPTGLGYTVGMRISCGFSGLVACLLVATSPAFAADNLFTLGTNAYLSDGAEALFAGDYERGIELTLEGLRREVAPGQRTAALSNLCAGYAGAKRYVEAQVACSEAIQLRATNWRAFNNRAIAHLGQGNYSAARQDVAQGLRLHPDSRQLHKVQAMIDARTPVLLADTD